MKRNNIVILKIFIVFGLYSCSNTKNIITQVASLETNTRTANFQTIEISDNNIYQKPLVCDLEVAKERYSVSKTYENMGIKDAKESAAGEFSIDKNCDYLVQPLYQTNTTTTDGKTTTTVFLSAYPAYYKNIRTFEPSDTASFHINNFVGLNNMTLLMQKSKEPQTAVASTTSSTITQTYKKINKNSKAHLVFSIDAGMPTGYWKEYYNTGIGGSLMVLMNLGKFVSIPTSFTTMQFNGKKLNLGFGSYYQLVDPLYYCVKTGLRLGNSSGLYGEGQIGYSIVSSADRIYGISSQSGLGWSIGAGYVIKKLDIGLRHETFGKINTTNNFIGIKLGLLLD